MLCADRLCIALRNKPVLADVSLKLTCPELVVVIGPNGAGKTTFLKALSGELPCDRGNVTLDNKPISAWPVEALAQRMAVLPQASALNFPFHVEEVVALGRFPHSSGARVDACLVEKSLELMDVTHLSERAYNTLSGGEKQRVQIARVFAQILHAPNESDKKLLLMDEPSSQLDIEHQHRLMVTLQTLKASGVLSVVVMHDFNLAAQYADRILVLAETELYAEGNVEDVFVPDMFKNVFNVDTTVMQHPESGRPVVISKLNNVT